MANGFIFKARHGVKRSLQLGQSLRTCESLHATEVYTETPGVSSKDDSSGLGSLQQCELELA